MCKWQHMVRLLIICITFLLGKHSHRRSGMQHSQSQWEMLFLFFIAWTVSVLISSWKLDFKLTENSCTSFFHYSLCIGSTFRCFPFIFSWNYRCWRCTSSILQNAYAKNHRLSTNSQKLFSILYMQIAFSLTLPWHYAMTWERQRRSLFDSMFPHFSQANINQFRFFFIISAHKFKCFPCEWCCYMVFFLFVKHTAHVPCI